MMRWLLPVLCFASLQQTHSAFALVWQIQTVDSGVYTGRHTSITLDNNSRPHISYQQVAGEDLRYAYWNGASWTKQTVDSLYRTGMWSNIRLDSAQNPHFTYYEMTNEHLRYARWNGNQWLTETVDDSGSVGRWNSLDLDAAGNPHISYLDTTNKDLKYASWNGSSWAIETVDSEGIAGYYTSLALDSSGNPSISYLSSLGPTFRYSLRYAHWDGSHWTTESIELAGSSDSDTTSLALDSMGRPHISWCNSSTDRHGLMYTYWDGLQWITTNVDSAGGAYGSLQLDRFDRPHICYRCEEKLCYAYWDGSSWSKEVVDPDGSNGMDCCLVLDSSGAPYISYHDITNLSLKFAYAVVPEPSCMAIALANFSCLLCFGGTLFAPKHRPRR